MEEIWKDIIDYEGCYQISSLGRVLSLQRYKTPQRILKPVYKEQGYTSVLLSKDDIKHRFPIHRLVATAFIPNPDNKPQVNHINGIKDDNRISNLEWCTNSENLIHSYHVLGRTRTPGSFSPVFINPKRILQIDKLTGETVNVFESSVDAVRKVFTDADSSTIRKCARGKLKTAYGYKWRYAV